MMKKSIFIKSFIIALLIFCAFQLPSEAKKYVLNLTPSQRISTKDEAISKGDILPFEVTKDLYVDGALFIAQGSPVLATVQFVEPNAWIGETPLLTLNYFETRDVTGDPVVIEYELNIKGKYGMSNVWQYTKYYTKSIIFCANLDIQPYATGFNVLFDKD